MRLIANNDGTWSAHDETYDIIIRCGTKEENKGQDGTQPQQNRQKHGDRRDRMDRIIQPAAESKLAVRGEVLV